MNEKGLSCGGLWLPGFTYFNEKQANDPKACDMVFVIDYILGNYATTQEVLAAFNSPNPPVNFFGISKDPKEPAQSLPIHYSLHDATGGSAVLEFLQNGITENLFVDFILSFFNL